MGHDAWYGMGTLTRRGAGLVRGVWTGNEGYRHVHTGGDCLGHGCGRHDTWDEALVGWLFFGRVLARRPAMALEVCCVFSLERYSTVSLLGCVCMLFLLNSRKTSETATTLPYACSGW